MAAVVVAALPSLSFAATISAQATSPNIQVGGSTEIAIDLVLGPGEDASIFEGFFDLVGDGTVVIALGGGDLVAGGPTWDSAFGSVGSQMSIVSLTSGGNVGGTRLVATLTVVGQSAGRFELLLGAGGLVARDVPPPEFSEEVPVTTPVGTMLVGVDVLEATPVPVVGSWLGISLLVASSIFVGAKRAA